MPNFDFNCTSVGFCRITALSTTNISNEVVWLNLVSLKQYSPYIATVEAIYFVLAFFWNVFILVSLVRHRKLMKEPASVYLFNLAVTDLMLAVFVILQCFISEVSGGFKIGNTDVTRCGVCEFLGFMLMFLMASTLHTLAMLSFDRFFLLLKPLSYQQYFNRKRALIIILFIWLLSFGIAIPPVLGFGEYAFNVFLSNCHPKWLGHSYRGITNFNYIVFVAGEAGIPIAFLTFTNMWTYKIVALVLKSKLQRQRSFHTKVKESESDHTRQQLQLAKVFGALFLAHIACWTPVLTAVAVSLIIGQCKLPVEVFIVGWLLYLTNPVVHPILETFFIKDLRMRVSRARQSVRDSLYGMGSLGHSLQRSWSVRSLRKTHDCSLVELNGKLPLSCKTSLDKSKDSPTSLKPPPLHENGDMLQRSQVKFTVIEDNFNEHSPVSKLEDRDISCLASNSVPRFEGELLLHEESDLSPLSTRENRFEVNGNLLSRKVTFKTKT